MLRERYVCFLCVMSYISVSSPERSILLPFIKINQSGVPVVHPHVALNIYPEGTDLTISVLGQVMFEPCLNIRPEN